MPVREIKTTLALDGEKAYKAALSDISREMRVLSSEMKAATSSFGNNQNSIEALTAKNSVLTREIDQQKIKVDSLRQAVSDASAKYGDADQKTDGYRIQLNNAVTSLNKLEGELKDNNATLEQAQKETEGAAAKTNKLGDEVSKAEKQTHNYGGSLDGLKNSLKVAAAGVASFVAATALITGLSSAIKTTANFEQELSNIKAVTGATASEMDSMRAAALKAGADTAYSASDAAVAEDELLKAGLSTAQVLNGGLNGALTLAAAGGIELGDAAEIAATALNAFKDDNLSVAQAADILAGAANASATDVGELKQGLSQVSAVASGMGLNFKDTSTALAVFAQNGLKGSDAGTSLKTMLMNLQPATDKQAKMFQQLGLITEDGTSAFYDATGSMRPLNEIAGLLQSSMANLTDADRAMALETMFGSDAIRAGNILFKEGADGVNNMAAAMGNVSAADVAAERMNNLNGAVESLKGSIETVVIGIGSQLTPGLMDLANQLTAAVNSGDWSQVGGVMSNAIKFAADNLTKAVPQIISVIVPLLSSVANSIATMIPTVLPSVVTGVVSIVGAIIGVLASQGPNLVLAAIQAASMLVTGILQTLPQLLQAAIDIVLALVTGISEQLPTLIPAAVQAVLTLVQTLVDNLPMLIDAAITLILALVDGVIAALPMIVTAAPQIITSLVNGVVGALPKLLDAALQIVLALINYLPQHYQLLINAMPQILSALVTGLINAVGAVWKFAPKMWSEVRTALESKDWGQIGRNVLDSLKNGISNAIGNIRTAALDVGQNIKNAFIAMPGEAWNWGKDIINGIVRGIKAAVGAVRDAVSGVAQNIRSFLHFSVPDQGPLVDFESWMPDFMKGLASGINQNKALVADAVKGLSGDMSLGLSSGSLALTVPKAAGAVPGNTITNNNARPVNININVTGGLDGANVEETARKLGDLVGRQLRAEGLA